MVDENFVTAVFQAGLRKGFVNGCQGKEGGLYRLYGAKTKLDHGLVKWEDFKVSVPKDSEVEFFELFDGDADFEQRADQDDDQDDGGDDSSDSSDD